MRRLTPIDFRFLIRFALSPPLILSQRRAASRRVVEGPKRDRALDMAADQVCVHFKGHEVHAPDPVKPH